MIWEPTNIQSSRLRLTVLSPAQPYPRTSAYIRGPHAVRPRRTPRPHSARSAAFGSARAARQAGRAAARRATRSIAAATRR